MLPRPLAELLAELAVAAQKHAIYPTAHPQIEGAVDRAMRRLDGVLGGGQPVALGVARTQLVANGIATDPMNPLVRELAQRLQRQRIGAVHLLPGVRRDELADFLDAVAVDHDRPQIALGAQTERWPHIVLTMVSYDRLELADGEVPDDAPQRANPSLVWLALARATLMAGAEGDAQMLLDPAALARAIDERDDAAYDQTVVSFLIQIAETLKLETGEESADVRSRVSDLVRRMQPQTLERLVDMGGDADVRGTFVLGLAQHLAADAVVSLVQAAANASNQAISHTLLRLLGKLALQAEHGGTVTRAGAGAALRDQVERLVDGWQGTRLNPESYQGALDRMAQRRASRLWMQRQHACEPKRLVMTSIETETLGGPVWSAVSQLMSSGGIATLLDLLDRAPAGNAVAEVLWPLVATPANVRHLLREEQVDAELLERIAARMGTDVVELLLEALETTEARALRRKLLDLLARFGSDVAPLVAARLAEPRPWYVQRNLLTLLAMLPELPAGFAPVKLMAHDDPRVRREALKVLLRTAEHRESSIIVGLSDRDAGIVQTALTAALDGCPKAAVALIMRSVDQGALTPEVRALGIRVVGAACVPETIEWLLGRAVTTSKILRRGKLLPKSPEMLAAVAALALGWRDDPRAAAVLELIAQSKDAEVRAAASPRRRTSERIATLS